MTSFLVESTFSSDYSFEDNAAEPFLSNAPSHYDDEELVDYSQSLVEDDEAFY